MKKQITTKIVILTIVSTILMCGLFAQSGQSQPPQPPPIPDDSQISQMVGELTQKLSLSDDQAIKILGLYNDHFAEVKSLTADGKPDRSKMDKLKNKFEKKVKALLTDKQIEEYEEFLKSQRPQRGPRK